jgi:hypothetical protein
MPANTRFLATSFARALNVIKRMFADRSLGSTWSQSEEMVLAANHSSLFLRLDAPKTDLAIVECDLVCLFQSPLSNMAVRECISLPALIES